MPKGLQGFQKGHPNYITQEIAKKIGDANRGKKRSDEFKMRISLMHKGKNFSGIENGKKTRFEAYGCKGRKLLGENGYRYLHKWIVKKLGQPTECEKCGTNDLIGHQIH